MSVPLNTATSLLQPLIRTRTFRHVLSRPVCIASRGLDASCTTAGVLVLKWRKLAFDANGIGQAFDAEVVHLVGRRRSARKPRYN
jgi:hypothetical protein